MKNLPAIILFTSFFTTGFTQSEVKPVLENEVYEFINYEFNTYDDKKITMSHLPYRRIIENEIYVDSVTTLTGTEGFIYELKREDTLKYFLTEDDYKFIISQIENPVLSIWKKEKFSKKIKFKSHKGFGFRIGIPLFSINREVVIFFFGYLERCRIYHWNKEKKEYVRIGGWMNGT